MRNKQTGPRGAGGLEQGKEGDWAWAWGSMQTRAMGSSRTESGRAGSLGHGEQEDWALGSRDWARGSRDWAGGSRD
jgi:hypothetical protein